MRAKVTLEDCGRVLAAGVLAWTAVAVVRVAIASRYSLRRVQIEDAGNDLLNTWAELERNFVQRAASLPGMPAGDPLWPRVVPKAEAPAPTPVAPRAAAPPPVVRPGPPPLPEVVAVLVDGEARALMRAAGRNVLVRPGDRIGEARVVHVERGAVTLDVRGARHILRLRAAR